jgi:hypothetical protein
MVAPDRLG